MMEFQHKIQFIHGCKITVQRLRILLYPINWKFNCVVSFSVLNYILRRVHENLRSVSTYEDDVVSAQNSSKISYMDIEFNTEKRQCNLNT